MKESILIVGGYGKVGGIIARQLCIDTIYPIIIAGRSLEKAQDYCKLLNGRATPAQLDLDLPITAALLEQIAVVIMCHEHANLNFAKQCLEHGIHYIDISASYYWLKQLETLHQQAIASRATAVLSVGFAPGLTNLMAMHAAKQLEQVEQINIGVLLGAGEVHGTAAIKWLLSELLQTFRLKGYKTNEGIVRNFTKRKSFYFTGLGKRSGYRFNFSDQHRLLDAHAAQKIGTYLTFDKEWLNIMLALMHRSKITSLLHIPRIEAAIIKRLQNKPLGSNACAIQVEAEGKNSNGESTAITLNFTAEQEAVQTAKAAACIANLLLNDKYPYGVHHIEQLFELELSHGATELTALTIKGKGQYVQC